MARYERPEEGEWIQPVEDGYKLSCCDCGLVHQMDFRIEEGRAQFRAFRDERATGQVRRHRSHMSPTEHADRVIANYLCLAQLPDRVKKSIRNRIAFEIKGYAPSAASKKVAK